MKKFPGEMKPQVVLILGMLLFAVLFSLFQAVSSLSGRSDSPEYDRVPPAAFVDVPYYTLFDSNKRNDLLSIEGGRVPDNSYVELLNISQNLTEKIFAGTLRENDLRRAGIGEEELAATWNEVASQMTFLSSENLLKVTYNPLRIKSLALPEGTVASVDADVDFDLSSGSGFISYSFINRQEAEWELTALSVN